jgi:hypothetical protein
VRQFGETESKANLRERLKAEGVANADRDLAIATEWFPLEEEVATLAQKDDNQPDRPLPPREYVYLYKPSANIARR